MSSLKTGFDNAFDLLNRIADRQGESGNRMLSGSLDVHGTASMLARLLPFDLPTLPGFGMPDFKDFDPLAAVANTSGASRVGAAQHPVADRCAVVRKIRRGAHP